MAKIVIINDDGTSTEFDPSKGLHKVATTGDYNDLKNKPLITNSENVPFISLNNNFPTYTLRNTDKNGIIKGSNTKLVTITIPKDTSLNTWKYGNSVSILLTNIGDIKFVPASGVTLIQVDGNTTVTKKGSVASLIKTGPNEWFLIGINLIK